MVPFPFEDPDGKGQWIYLSRSRLRTSPR